VIRIAATSHVPAPRRIVFAFLADRDNHWHLAGRRIEALEIGQDAAGQLSGLVLIRGPFGVRRRARTRVVQVSEPMVLGGVAELGRRTTAVVRWDLGEVAGGEATRVELSASVTAASPLDRLLLALGGRVWMKHVFAVTLELLADRLQGAQARAALQAA
jgi:hypothetical protein